MTFAIDVADFATFCRSKGELTYDYSSNCACALATYLIEAKGLNAGYGPNSFSVGGEYVSIRGADYERFEHGLSVGIRSALHAGNYRDLAVRLEALLPAAPASPWTEPAAYLAFAEQPA